MVRATVLHRSLAADLQVGTNLRGAVSGGGWLYALPRLEFRSIVCLGAPTDATLATLARAGASVLVVEASTRRRQRVERSSGSMRWSAIRVVEDVDAAAIGSPDLVVAADGRMTRRRTTQLAMALERLVPDGYAYVATAALDDPVVDRLASARGYRRLAVGPTRGEAHSVVPVDDASMRRTLRRLGLEGSATFLRHPRLAARERRVRAALPFPRRERERTTVLIGAGSGPAGGLPDWIRSVAAEGGRDLTGWRWGVAARGEYDSQKVLVLLAPPASPGPTGLVKVTRSSTHADRLENEGVVLEHLGGLPVATGRAPELWFRGRHADRAILGESMAEGVPFPDSARWEPRCPHLTDALAWLTDLGAATRAAAPATAVAEALLALLERYVAIHPAPPPETAFLRERFSGLAAVDAPIPTVLQHGDPGIWNLLVDDDGRTVFLDWEAGELDGLPLWDLLYFFRSYAVAASRRAGVRDRLEAASRHLLATSPLGERFAEAVTTYRARVGVPAEAVEALVYGCWVHRALKEATRMAPGHAGEGQYVRLIRRMVSGPTAPILAAASGAPA
jgi:hypothetical protein